MAEVAKNIPAPAAAAPKSAADGRALALKMPDIRMINAGLFAIFGMLTVMLTLNGISQYKVLHGIPRLSASSGQFSALEKETVTLGELSAYLDKADKKDIFRMGPKSGVEVEDVISSRAADAANNLRLVGISWSDNPEAMIEDSKTSRTFFVKRGELVNDMKVEAVYKDRVILRFESERIELR